MIKSIYENMKAAKRGRAWTIQTILDRLRGKTYLEIGLGGGRNFFAIKAKRKIGVDVKIRKKIKGERLVRALPNMLQLKTEKLLEMTSDDMFNKKRKFLVNKIDVAFVDGLHTYQQALRDVVNCLEHLSSRGFIVVHDCLPTSENMGYPVTSNEEAKERDAYHGPWCGDVWKAIVYLRCYKRDLCVFTLDCDFGLGVVYKGEPESMLHYSTEDIERMSYRDLKLNKKEFLNLKNREYAIEFLKILNIEAIKNL